MKNIISKKSLMLSIFALLFVMSLGFASAVLSSSAVTLTGVAHDSGSTTFTFNLTSTAAETGLTFATTANNNAGITIQNAPTTIGVETKTISATVTYPKYLTSITGSITVTTASLLTLTIPVSVSMTAATTFSVSTPTSLTPTKQTTFTITNTGNQQITPVIPSTVNLNDRDSNQITLTLVSPAAGTSIAAGLSQVYKYSLGSTLPTTAALAGLSTTFNITASTASQAITIPVEKDYCKLGVTSNSFIEITDIEDKSQGDDWEWDPVKEVNVRVKVVNHDIAKRKITVKLGLYDTANKKFIEMYNGDSEFDSSLRIDEGDSGTYDFSFKMPGDVDFGTYRLYVKAYGDDGSYTESNQCTGGSEVYKTVSVTSDDDLAIDELQYASTNPCGTTQTVSLRVYNYALGDEEYVRVGLYNKELGINAYSDKFELSDGDSKSVQFTFNIPSNVEEKAYPMQIYLDYDYNENTDVFKSTNSKNTFKLNVQGSCQTTQAVGIAASLSSSDKPEVGKELSITTTIANNKLANATGIVLSIEGYDSWANTVSVDPSILTLNKGDSKTVTIKLTPTASGAQTFKIKALYNSGQSSEQLVQVNVAEKSGVFTGFASKLGLSSGNSKLYAISAIFLVLIIIVIIAILMKLPKAE